MNLPAPFEDGGLRVTADGFYKLGRSYVGVSGTARNVSGRDFEMCSIRFDVVDESGAKVCDAHAFTQGLKAGQEWRFQAAFATSFATTFKSIQRGTVTTIPVPKG